MHLKGLKRWWNACFYFSSWQTLTKHAQALKKQTKESMTWSSPNAEASKKPNKNQTTRCTKPAQASKKQKKQKYVVYRPPTLSRCSEFWFFGFFDACAGFVHLVVWFFGFFWCLCRFCKSNLHQTCTGIKKTKNPKHESTVNLIYSILISIQLLYNR